jgi:hypothetical protein
MIRSNLEAAQSAMKARLQRETAKKSVRPLGRSARRTISSGGRVAGESSRRTLREPRRRSIRARRDGDGKKQREHLCQEKGVISHHIEVDEIFLSNVKTGKQKPPEGEPWEYYLFCNLVIRKTGKRGPIENRVHYVERLEGKSREECDELLLEFVTRPDVICESVKNL